VALALKAVQRGVRVYFSSATSLLISLMRAYAENRFEDKLKFYTLPKLLVIDEIGYVPIDRHAATSLLPAHLAPVRAGRDDADQQPRVRPVGRDLR
jgi:DNA replication protein DnaC